LLPGILLALVAGSGGVATGAEPAAQPAKSATAQAAQRHFPSAEAAATELVAAVKSGDAPSILAVLGNDAKPIVESGDAVADKEMMQRFVDGYEAKHSLHATNARRSDLVVGDDDWPFPIPIVKESAGWRFDTAAGQEEILDRRVGRNEHFTIQTCLAVVDAQRDYYARNPNHDSLNHYARRFNSTEGKRDGLYYPTGEDEDESPLGALVAQAGTRATRTSRFPITATTTACSSPRAERPRRRLRYVAKDQMIGGFAVVAYPASYDNSGVMTFIVNHDGVVYQKDLGSDTAKTARAIERFDPDKSWERVPDAEQAPESVSAD
jgi:hypothetical protein